MTRLALAVSAAYGVHLLYTALVLGWTGIGAGPRRARLRRPTGGVREWLAQAGLEDVRPVEFLGVVGVLFVVGAALGFAIFGGPLPAFVLAAFAATFPIASYRARRRARRALAQEAWPRMLEEIRIRTGALGRSVPQALFEVGRRGPVEMQPAFEAAHREWLASTDFARTVGVLKERLADPTADVTCETLLVAHELGGTDLDRRIEALVEDRIQDVQGRKDARAKQAGVRFARRFVLIVPLGMALAGMSMGNGRSAYATPFGQLAVGVGIAVVVLCWAWSGAIMRIPEEERVFSRSPAARPLVVVGLVLWVGATLLLSTQRWFARRPLTERLRPYSPGGMATGGRTGLLSVETFREVVGPLSSRLGEHVARVFGVHEDLATRLARIHSPLDVTAVRVRQLGWAVGAFGVAGLVSLTVRVPPAMSLLFLLGAPLLGFLVVEQSVSRASQRWQRHLLLELPVVSEQLGMLLSAGFSLGTAINRVASRGSGCCAQDLRVVRSRIQQGLGETEALREWADVSGVPAVERLVQVLALNRQAGDLGRLISEEARAIRRDVQRELVERIERREQVVWIPVTVATLVPGVIFMAVPFVEAMRLFAGS